MKTLRPYQTRMYAAAINAIVNNVERTSYYAATGAGKTVVFQQVIDYVLKEKMLPSKAKKILVVHPRIALSIDQQDRFREDFRIPYTSFHSGKVVQSTTRDDEANVFNKSTTSVEQLTTMLDERAHTDQIVFTTYESLRKIAGLDWDLIICDEAHYLATAQFAPILDEIKSQVMFFTATPIKLAALEHDFSMDNVEKFGEVVATVSPNELIKLGYMVRPDLFKTVIKTDQNGDVENFSESIARTFNSQREMLSDKIPHKMLVALPNTQSFDDIMNDLEFMRDMCGDNLEVFYIKASTNKRNGSIIADRDVALKQFAETQSPAIMIHCDTLAEGIDIDGLTGAYISRELAQAKFIQTIGRCVRPYASDFKADRTPKKFENRIKQTALINIAIIDNDSRVNAKVVDWYKALLEAGYPEIQGGDPKATLRGAGEAPEPDALIFSGILDVNFERAVEEIENELGEW